MAEEQPQRRRSFDEVLNDALTQWNKRFERALEEQRQVIGQEADKHSDEIERATLEHLGMIEQTVAARAAELAQAAREQKDAFDEAVTGRSKELDTVGEGQAEVIVKVANDALQELEEKATSEVRRIEKEITATRDQVRRSVAEGAKVFEEFAEKRLEELEDILRAKLEGFRRESVEETHRVRDATAEQLNETRSLVTAETRRVEEGASVARDEMRRVAAEEAAAFDKLARERIGELQDALRGQTEMLGEFTRMHESMTQQLDDVRAFAKDTTARMSSLDQKVSSQLRENEESAAAAAETLKRTSATELNSIQQRAIALDELARKHIANVERQVGKLFEAETATAEGLREFERQMESRRTEIERELESRRTEIETLLDDRTAALTQQVRQAESAVVRRITELGERAETNAEALDRRLARETDERTKELDAFAEAIMQSLDTRIAQVVEEASAAGARDPRMTKLLQMLAAVQVALDQITDRVVTLEGSAGDADDGADGQVAPRAPLRDPASTPDLRGDR
jgi:DNA-binding protein H-NS